MSSPKKSLTIAFLWRTCMPWHSYTVRDTARQEHTEEKISSDSQTLTHRYTKPHTEIDTHTDTNTLKHKNTQTKERKIQRHREKRVTQTTNRNSNIYREEEGCVFCSLVVCVVTLLICADTCAIQEGQNTLTTRPSQHNVVGHT